MYRCYLLRESRIVKAENLDAATLEEAIVIGRQVLTEQAPNRGFNGLEIWLGASLLYSGTGDDAKPPEGDASSRDEVVFVQSVSDQFAMSLQRSMES